MRAKLSYDKLLIEGKTYKLEDFPDLVFSNLKSRKTSSTSTNNSIQKDNLATQRTDSQEQRPGLRLSSTPERSQNLWIPTPVNQDKYKEKAQEREGLSIRE